MKLTIIAATRNQHKLKELNRLLKGTNLRLRSLDDFPAMPEVVENGRTLEANALKKARAVAKALALPALSDDSGLFVPALQGKPGVRSARYAGPKCDYAANNRKLLQAMRQFTGRQRRAYFATTLALVWPGKKSLTWTGRLSGKITSAPAGGNGFGYDPVFIPTGHQVTLAQMSLNEKNKISHRSRALAKAALYFKKQLEKKTLKG